MNQIYILRENLYEYQQKYFDKDLITIDDILDKIDELYFQVRDLECEVMKLKNKL